MKIIKKAMAGTMESNDALIVLEPNEAGIQIDLTSPVEAQYGQQIRQVITDVMECFCVENVRVTVVDHGALDCTLRARAETALFRSQEEGVQ